MESIFEKRVSIIIVFWLDDNELSPKTLSLDESADKDSKAFCSQ